MRILDKQRLNKEIVQIADITDIEESNQWITKTPMARLEGLEILRQMWSAYDPDTERLQRVYSIIERT